MTIRPRKTADGQVRYQAKIRLRGHPIQTATFRTKTDAKRWVQDTESAIRHGRYFQILEASAARRPGCSARSGRPARAAPLTATSAP